MTDSDSGLFEERGTSDSGKGARVRGTVVGHEEHAVR